MAGNVEREVKLGAWAGLVLPNLTDVVPGGSAVALRPLRLRATYYDTADLRLARSGITARYRTEVAVAGDEPAHRSGGWTVKFPEAADGPGLSRREIDIRGGEARIPAAVLHLVRAHIRLAPLVPVARLRTDRVRTEVRDSDGKRLVEVDDDEVSVLVPGPDGRARRVAARFRELEAELAPGGTVDVLESVVERLRAAGAGAPDPTPKVVRALGPRALAPPDVVPAKVGSRSTAGEVVQAAVASSVARLLAKDPGVRLGEDPEDVHQARVATRRLRSDLRTFRPLLNAAWVAGLRAELGWIAGLLGAVRDTDVLLEHLRADISRLDAGDAPAGAAMLRRLEAERRAARAALVVALDSDRYVVLLEELVAAGQQPRFAPPPVARQEPVAPEPAPVPQAPAAIPPPELARRPPPEPAVPPTPATLAPGTAGPSPVPSPSPLPAPDLTPAPEPEPPPPLATDPARDVLPALVRRPWRHLRRAVEVIEAGGSPPPDASLHEVRILSKRCRYAAEAAVPAIGKPATRFGSAVADLQGVLGDLNDAVVAEVWLRQAAARAPAAQVLVVGQLIDSQRHKAAECRAQWPAAWKRASAKSLRRWLAGS